MTPQKPLDRDGVRPNAPSRLSSPAALPLLLGLAVASALWLFAPRAEAACDPDTPPLVDDGAVTCTGSDETGFDASANTGVVITTDGTVVIDDSGAENAGVVVGDGNTVTLGADSTLNVVDTDGVGLLGGDDNLIDLDGSINVNVANGVGIRMGSNTDPDSSSDADVAITNGGNISISGAGAVGIDVGDNYSVTNEVGGTITVEAGADGGVAIRGVNDNVITNTGTILLDADDARGIQVNENTGLPLPNGVIGIDFDSTDPGTITINGARGVAIEVGDNTGTVVGDTNLNGVEGIGLLVGNKSDPDAEANHTNLGTIEVSGDGSIGMWLGDNWISGTGSAIVNDVVNRETINVSGANAFGIRVGDDANAAGNNNSFVNNNVGATITVTGTDAVGVSLGGNDVLDGTDTDLDSLFSFGNGGTVTGGEDAGPLIEFRSFNATFENRVLNVSGGVIAADRTNAGVANRGIAVQGTAGVEAIDNGGEITGDVFLLEGDDLLDLSGEMTGTVDLGDGDDFAEFRLGGTLTGDLELGDGADEVLFRAGSTLEGAVAGGAGNDRFENASEVTFDLDLGGDEDVFDNLGLVSSDIALGTGNDEYRHDRGAAISDGVIIDGGAGTDDVAVLTFSTVDPLVGATGFDLSRLENFERVQLEGMPGMPTNDANAWFFENTTGFDGTIEVLDGSRLLVQTSISAIDADGDFVAESGSAIGVIIDDAATVAIRVAGTATLAGELALGVDPTLSPGNYGLVEAATRIGTFDDVALPDPSGLVTYSTVDTPTGVELVIARVGTFADPAVAFGANNQAIGAYLDAIDGNPGTSTALTDELNLIAASNGSLNNILSALSPESYDAQTALVVEGGRRVARLLMERPRDCTPGELDPWQGTAAPLQCHARAWAPWVSAVGSYRSRNGFAGHPEYDALLGGGVFGVDAPSIAGFDFTVAVSTQGGEIDYDRFGDARLNLLEVSGYAGWSHGPLRIQTVATWAHTRHDSSRSISYVEGTGPGAVFQNVNAEEEFDSQRLLLAAEIGLLFHAGPVTIEPIAAVDWATIETDGFAETKGGPWTARIERRDDDLLTTRAGLRLGSVFEYRRYLHRYLEWATGVWRPTLDFRWRQTHSGNERELRASLVGGPDDVAPFQVTAKEDEGGFELGLGVSFAPKYLNRVQAQFRYDVYHASHTIDHDLTLRFRVGF
ncbi:MAG: autotransporter domain-containing protein [Myxococcota bacterium]